jgi:hypothetical protein
MLNLSDPVVDLTALGRGTQSQHVIEPFSRPRAVNPVLFFKVDACNAPTPIFDQNAKDLPEMQPNIESLSEPAKQKVTVRCM